MKKILTILLSVLLVFGTFPVHTALAAEDDENIALGKTVTASSTMSAYSTSNVNDGNLNTLWARADYATGAYIQIDLGEAHRITKVVLHNRLDIDQANYRTRVNLEFSNTSDFSVKERIVAMGDDPAPYGEGVEVPITFKTPYRYVRAVKQDVFIFVLAEMEIYGHIVDPNAMELGEDVAGSPQAYAITLLSHLGLVNNVNEDIFGVDYLMTRGEAAEMVVDAFGGNASFSGYIPFNDVEKNHPNYASIMSAYHLGYVTGDDNTTFRPDDYITKTELMYMTLRAIGYGEVVQVLFDNSVTRLLQQAESLDLLKDVPTESYNEPISRGDAAVVFYNALLAPAFNLYAFQQGYLVVEEETTLLLKRHNMILQKGIVEETKQTTLSGAAKTGKNTVKISGASFSDPSGQLNGYLGQSVTFARYADDDEIVLAWPTEKNAEVILPASRLISMEEDIAAGRIKAMDADGDDERYDLEDKFNVIRNGVAHPYYTAQDLMLSNGQLRLLDNDRDDVYEVVFIEEYTLHYVDSAFSDDNELTIIDNTGTRVTVQREELSIKNGAGVTQSLNKVAKDTVIKLFSTPDGTGSWIVVYNEPPTGTLTSISDEDAAIGGITYPFSQFYKDNRPVPEAVPGDAVRVYVDEGGELLWIERDIAGIDSEWILAYSQKTAISSGLTPTVRFRMFTVDATWVEYEVADKVTVDGVSMEREELARLLTNAAPGIYVQELLRLKLNDAGAIRELDTIQQTQDFAATSDFVVGERIGAAMFTAGSSAFWDYHNMVGQAKRDTPAFIIPVENGVYATSSANDGLFGVSTVYNLCGNNSRNSQNLLAYMPDEYGYPVCFVRTTNGVSPSSNGGTITAVTVELAPIMVVEKVTQTAVDGELYFKVSGRDVETKGTVSFLADPTMLMIETGLLYQNRPDCLGDRNLVSLSAMQNLSQAELEQYTSLVTEIGFGDIIRYQTLTTAVRAVERVFDYNAPNMPVWGNAAADPGFNSWYTVSGGASAHYSGFYRFQFGSFKEVTRETFVITTLAGLEEVYLKNAFMNILVCDASGAKPQIKEERDIARYGNAGYRVMLYSYNGSPRTAIIFPY